MVASRLQATTYRVVLLLAVAGGLLVALRLGARHEDRLLRGDTFWHVVYDISFKAKKPGARLHVALPADTAHSRIFQQQVKAPNLTMRRLQNADERELIVAAAAEGSYRISAEFDIHLSPRASWRAPSPPAPRSAEGRAEYLKSRKGIEVDDPVVAETLERLQWQPASKADLVERLFEYCLAELGAAGRAAPNEAAAALREGTASALGRARAMVALCRASKLPARPVAGFHLRQGSDVRPHVWVEVLTGGRWEPYDPENGFIRELPHYFVPARRDGVSIVSSRDVGEIESRFSLARVPPPVGMQPGDAPRLVDLADLSRLPIEMHEALSVILLMPLGALVTSIFRTMIGIRTFGTFTPSLVALAFVYNDWRTGLVVFLAVMVLGLASRALLERMRLLLVPRLSVILTLVAWCMVFGVSILDYLDLTPSAQAVLLPMVILTMTVERFFLTSEEDGPRFALELLAGTLLVASICYLVLRWQAVGQLLLAYPELHLFTIAALIVMGRYTGYRASELWRFRDLAA